MINRDELKKLIDELPDTAVGDLVDFALDLRGTAFERQVWQALREVSTGATLTYGALAGRLGFANGARAIGGAVRRNPISLIVPCHRIIGARGSLTGYGGGLEREKWLLQHEGTADGLEVERQMG